MLARDISFLGQNARQAHVKSKTHHQRVDEGVDENKLPDGSRHVSDASPHAEHGTGVVVGLEGRAELALGEDDEGIENLVKLAQVEDPAVKGQPLVPQAARLRVTGQAVHQGSARVRGLKGARGVVVVDGVSEARAAVQTAEAVNGARPAVRARRAGDAATHAAEHGPKGPGRVDAEEDIVEDDKGEEGPRLADGPGLLVAALVVDVEALDGDGVEGANGQRNLGVEGGLEEVLGDVEGPQDGGRNRVRGNGLWHVDGRKVEQARVGQRPEDVKIVVGHDCGVCVCGRTNYVEKGA